MEEEKKMEKTNSRAGSSRGKEQDHSAGNAGDLSGMNAGSDAATQAARTSTEKREAGSSAGARTTNADRGMERQFDTPNKVVLPGDDREGQTSGAFEGDKREGAPGSEENNPGVRKGDDDTQPKGMRIPSKMSDQNRDGVGRTE